MKTVHFVAGLPRSGSTLLCNVLNQNPKIHASGTSAVPQIVGAARQSWAKSDHVQSQIDAEKEHYFKRFSNVIQAIIQAWYQEVEEDIIFDKSRAWNGNYLLLRQLYESPKMVVCIRDLRGIFGSIEKHNIESMLYGGTLKQTMANKIKQVFNVKGIIGSQLMHLYDMSDRDLFKEMLVIKYEEFSANPKETLDNVYDFIGEEKFQHDFDNVKRVTQEDDSVYRYNYPHRGEGKVTPVKDNDWLDVIPEKAAKVITQQNETFYKIFGY